MNKRQNIAPGAGILAIVSFLAANSMAATPPTGIIHDAEHYILEAQHGEKWLAEDKILDQKLAELKD